MTIGRPLEFKSVRERIGYVLNYCPLWASRLSIKNGLIALVWVSVVATFTWHVLHPDGVFATTSAQTQQVGYTFVWFAVVLSVIVAGGMIFWTVVDIRRWQHATRALRDRPQKIAETLRDHDFLRWLGIQVFAGHRRDQPVAPRQLLLTTVLLTYHRKGMAPRWLQCRAAAVVRYTQAIATKLEQE